ncbi:hypothetical protein Dimus_013943 [Dionaea muscipula]
MTVIYLKKKDVVKSSVKGVAIEFDHDRSASILVFPERIESVNTSKMRGGVKDHELPYGDWLTMVFEEFSVPLVDKKREEPKRYDYFEETFLTMCKLTRENGVWWVGTRENRRRDDVVNAPEEKDEEGGNQAEFDWEAIIDKVAVEGNPASMSSFTMLKWMWKNQEQRLQLLRSGRSSFGSTEGNKKIGSRPSYPTRSNSVA